MGQFQHSNLEPFWDTWYIDSVIGEGSFGTVYKIYQKDYFNNKTYSALKIISIPKSPAELKQLTYRGMDLSSSAEYFRDIAENIYKEIDLMAQLKAKTNIVSYEDHKIIPKENGIGYYILIRMELLQCLNDYLLENAFTDEDALSLAKDMCKALNLCHKRDIIHRDIKPDNIFISADGDYKIGDFGIARKFEGAKNGLSIVGTFEYMAPEVFRGDAYDERVDIYSLGMVLYYYLNNRKEPFCNTTTSALKQSDLQESQSKRMAGEKLPKPLLASDRFAEIVLKACAFDPNDRYQTPDEFLNALNTLANSDIHQTVLVPLASTSSTPMRRTLVLDNLGNTNQEAAPKEAAEFPSGMPVAPTQADKAKKSKIKRIVLSLAGIVLAASVVVVILLVKNNKDHNNELADIPVKDEVDEVISEPSEEEGELADAAVAPEESEPADAIITAYELEFEPNAFSGFLSIEDIEKLTSLSIPSNNLTTVEELRNSLILDYLDLQYNNLQSIEALSNMSILTCLNVSDNQIEDLSPLRQLASLEVLILSNNKISSIDALSQLTSLTTLQLDGNEELQSVQALLDLKNLQVLTLTGTGVTDISPLYDLTSLTILDITGLSITQEQLMTFTQKVPGCMITR